MFNTLRAAVGIGIAVLLSARAASPQGLVMQRNLSLAMAKTIAEAALTECKSKGFSTAVAVVDRAGQVLVILRDEQATAQQAEMARRNGVSTLAPLVLVRLAELGRRTNRGGHRRL